MIQLMGPSEPYLTKQDVIDLTGLDDHQIDDLIAGGEFPRAVLVSPRKPRWKREDVIWYMLGRELLPRLGPPAKKNSTRQDPVEGS